MKGVRQPYVLGYYKFMNPLVSIVTICWNRKDDILESLNAISQIEYDNLEIIVVDNNSNDGTSEAIEMLYPSIRLIKMFKNIGIEAYNVGFKNAKGKYIVILDDDSFPEKHSILRMVEKFKRDKKLGIAAFDVRNYYNYDEIVNTNIENNENHSVTSNYLMGFNGAGAGMRKNLFEKIGFYPEEFFLYWNEQDTAFKVLNSGYKIQFFPDLVSYHKYSPKNRNSLRAPFYYSRNAFWLIWKNYPIDLVIKLTFKLIYMVLYYSFEQKTTIYIKGLIDAFKNCKLPLNKRKPIKRNICENIRIPFETSFTFFR